MENNTDNIASKFLGTKVIGSEQYDSSLLIAIPRAENRLQYDIEDTNLPFNGYDLWHAYEFSALTKKGLPVTRVLKIKYNCNSKYLIESKSLKLYLNSFNMTYFGEDTQDCLNICREIIKNDLSKKLGTEVEISYLNNDSEKVQIFSNYINIKDYINENDITINKFKESPELLDTENLITEKEYFLTYDSLRSNCRVTHQPDFGDLFIYYKSQKHILEDTLVKYITSFRKEYHFHEECCEMIFKRLYDILNNKDKLMVCALYTRRGGIDICPIRYSKNFVPKEIEALVDTTKFARNGIKQ